MDINDIACSGGMEALCLFLVGLRVWLSGPGITTEGGLTKAATEMAESLFCFCCGPARLSMSAWEGSMGARGDLQVGGHCGMRVGLGIGRTRDCPPPLCAFVYLCTVGLSVQGLGRVPMVPRGNCQSGGDCTQVPGFPSQKRLQSSATAICRAASHRPRLPPCSRRTLL